MYRDDGAMKLLNEWKPADMAPLVQIAGSADADRGDDVRERAADQVAGD